MAQVLVLVLVPECSSGGGPSALQSSQLVTLSDCVTSLPLGLKVKCQHKNTSVGKKV